MSYWNALIVERVLRLAAPPARPAASRTGCGEKSIFLSSSFHSYIGKSTIQQNLNTSFFDQAELVADPRARRAGELRRRCPPCRRRRTRRRRPESRAFATAPLCASAARYLAIGPLPAALALAFEDDIAEARRALALRPVVQLVEEAARLRRRRPAPGSRARRRRLRSTCLKTLNVDVVALEDLGHVGDHDRVAQVRLVGAVFQHRFVIGDARERRLGHRLAARRIPRTRRAAPARSRRTRRPA